MGLADAFQPLGGELRIALTQTPTAPFRVLHPNGEGASQIRIALFSLSAGEARLAYGSSAAEVTAIAGTGGETTAGVQTTGVITLVGPTEVEVLSLPNGAWFSAWSVTAGATGDLYLTPGAGV